MDLFSRRPPGKKKSFTEILLMLGWKKHMGLREEMQSDALDKCWYVAPSLQHARADAIQRSHPHLRVEILRLCWLMSSLRLWPP